MVTKHSKTWQQSIAVSNVSWCILFITILMDQLEIEGLWGERIMSCMQAHCQHSLILFMLCGLSMNLGLEIPAKDFTAAERGKGKYT